MTTTNPLKTELIRLLTKATEERFIQWESTADEVAFRLTSELGNIRISKSEEFDREMMESYTNRQLSILNDRGRTIEEFFPETASEVSDFDKLYALARRSAYNTDSIIEGMISALRAKVPE